MRGRAGAIKCRGRHVPFIFLLINKSAGIWLIGIDMNAKTVSHRAFRSPGDDVDPSCLRFASALAQNATRAISGFGVGCRCYELVPSFGSARVLDRLIIARGVPLSGCEADPRLTSRINDRLLRCLTN